MISLAFFLFCLGAVCCQIPLPCCNDEALRTKRCCPSNADPCLQSQGRGECRPIIPNSRARGVELETGDTRDRWPSKYFNMTCKCNGNFGGHDCSECADGFKGPNCDQPHVVVRRDIRSLSEKERVRYFSLLHYCKGKLSNSYCIVQSGDLLRKDAFVFKRVSVYDTSAFTHHYANKPLMVNSQTTFAHNFAHRAIGFLTWHRAFLRQFEREFQKCAKDDTIALHYYNWLGDSNCSVCTSDLLCDNDIYGQLDVDCIFSRWRSICGGFDYNEQLCWTSGCECERPRIQRRPGFGVGFGSTLPVYEAFTNCTRINTYSGYANCIENIHNQVHVYMQGSMAVVPVSANDIMFYFHHSFTDSLMEYGIRSSILRRDNYPTTTALGHNRWDFIVPLIPCVTHNDMIRNSMSMGFDFDYFSTTPIPSN